MRWNSRPNPDPSDDPHAWRDAELERDGAVDAGYRFKILKVEPMGFGRKPDTRPYIVAHADSDEA